METRCDRAPISPRLIFGLAIMAWGLMLTLDNFGTVRSTRAGLLLPVDIIKLDSSVTQTPESSRHQAVLASLRELSSADGPLVIGEGIEDPSQLAVLEGVGWRYAQGYLLGRPRPAHDER